jgi:cytidyltransferase-like protein
MGKKVKIVTLDNLQDIRGWYVGKRIVFVSGTYDLIHPGHVRFFELAKQVVHADILVSGVGCDADIKRYKGDSRPIMDENARLTLVAALEVVDCAFITHAPPEGTGHFLDGFIKIFRTLQPDAYVVIEDAFDMERRRNLAKENLVEFAVLNLSTAYHEWKDLSSSNIIKRILTVHRADEEKRI